jgi:hypothetical protein
MPSPPPLRFIGGHLSTRSVSMHVSADGSVAEFQGSGRGTALLALAGTGNQGSARTATGLTRLWFGSQSDLQDGVLCAELELVRSGSYAYVGLCCEGYDQDQRPYERGAWTLRGDGVLFVDGSVVEEHHASFFRDGCRITMRYTTAVADGDGEEGGGEEEEGGDGEEEGGGDSNEGGCDYINSDSVDSGARQGRLDWWLNGQQQAPVWVDTQSTPACLCLCVGSAGADVIWRVVRQ